MSGAVTSDDEHWWQGKMSMQALGINSNGVFITCMLQLVRACFILYNMLRIVCTIVV